MNWYKIAQATTSTYTISSGDTLGSIAQKILGSANRWREIKKLNPGIDERRLQIGQIINIPIATSSASPVVTPSNETTPESNEPSAISGDTTGKNTNKKDTGSSANKNETSNQSSDLEKRLMKHEGFREYAYSDPPGQNEKLSIGYGFQLDPNNPKVIDMLNKAGPNAENERLDVNKLRSKKQRVTEQQARILMGAYISEIKENEISRYIPNLESHPKAVQDAMLDMYYNMGINGFAQFKKMHAAVNRRDYATAAREMMTNSSGGKSKYAKDVGKRAVNLSEAMRNAK